MSGEVIRFYWDSCCWISFLSKSEKRIGALADIFDALQRESVELWSSALVMIEVIKLESDKGSKRPTSAQDRAAIDQAFAHVGVKRVPCTLKVLEAARDLRRSHDLKTADAIHVATALTRPFAAMHTYDERLLALNGKLISKQGKPLTICEPRHRLAGTLFDPATRLPSEGQP